jgi:hypothetical protein
VQVPPPGIAVPLASVIVLPLASTMPFVQVVAAFDVVATTMPLGSVSTRSAVSVASPGWP